MCGCIDNYPQKRIKDINRPIGKKSGFPFIGILRNGKEVMKVKCLILKVKRFWKKVRAINPLSPTLWTDCRAVVASECGMIGGGLLTGLITVVVVLIVLGTAIPVLWPLAANTTDNITAMTGTDAGTTTIQAFWPVILLVVGMGLAVGLIMFGLRKFGLFSDND